MKHDATNLGAVADGPPGRVPVGAQIRAWMAIGGQSLGGGAATLYLMRRILVLRERWVTEAELLDDWSLSRVSPGVSLIALSALLGKRLGGRRGVAIALVGLLGPGVVTTIALTIAFSEMGSNEAVDRAFVGMGVAALGLSIGVMGRMARASVRGGRAMLVDTAVFLVALICGLLTDISPVTIVFVGALVGIAFLGRAAARSHSGPG